MLTASHSSGSTEGPGIRSFRLTSKRIHRRRRRTSSIASLMPIVNNQPLTSLPSKESQDSRALTNVAWVRSSASATSLTIRVSRRRSWAWYARAAASRSSDGRDLISTVGEGWKRIFSSSSQSSLDGPSITSPTSGPSNFLRSRRPQLAPASRVAPTISLVG